MNGDPANTPPGPVSNPSPAEGAVADIRPVLPEFTRRRLLQAGSVFGLLSLVGCASEQQVAGEPMPKVPWPDPVPTPAPIARSTPAPTPSQPLPPKPQPPVVGPQAGLPSNVIPRTRWAPATLGNPRNAKPMNGVSWITIHHDGMNAFYAEDEGSSMKRLQSIRTSHMQRRAKSGENWADIGYHFAIDRAGRIYECRPLSYQGAHVEDENEHNIGVLCMGNFEKQAPTQAQKDTLDQFVAQLMRDYRVPLTRVRTHKEWPSASTDCPGRALQTYMARTRARGGGMALTLAASDASLLA